MNLVIVESPTKARKLTTYLGSQYKVKASVGHVRDLPKSKLGVDLENNFEPTYQVPRGKGKVVKELQQLAKSSSKIFLAMDPDREGEAIAWHVQQLLLEKGAKDENVFERCTFHEITKQAVLDAIKQPTQLNSDLVDAQQARRVVDRLVGYKISPVLWRKIRRGLSAGRVQSVAVRLIVERERERDAFDPQEYWEFEVAVDSSQDGKVKKPDQLFVDGKLVKDLPIEILNLNLHQINGKKLEIDSEEKAKPVTKDLSDANYKIVGVEKKERKQQSKPPFTTSTLQQTAAYSLGFSAKQTMILAQQLYEEGLITYHRTDSFNLSASSLEMAREYIQKEYGKQYLSDKVRVFRSSSKNAQEAHEAIRITDVKILKEQVPSLGAKLSERHARLYDLIWRRFVATQMEAVIFDQTTIFVDAVNPSNSKTTYNLKTTGSIMKFPGWRRLFPTGDDVILPEINKGQTLEFLELNPLQKFTQPPPRYNDASLVKELEKRGIGRPSTYASIISVIQDRGYVDRENKAFVPTAIGFTVCDFLIKHFEGIMDYDFTAEMEENLDRIARGEKEWRKVMANFWQPLEGKIDKVIETAQRAQIPVESTGEICPDCGEKEKGEIVIRTGRYGKFRSCSRYPDCKFTEPIVEKLEGFSCPLCSKGEIIIKPTRYGKSFYGCSRYPDCDWASWKKPEKGLKVTAKEWKQMQKEREERKAKRKGRGKGKGKAKTK